MAAGDVAMMIMASGIMMIRPVSILVMIRNSPGRGVRSRLALVSDQGAGSGPGDPGVGPSPLDPRILGSWRAPAGRPLGTLPPQGALGGGAATATPGHRP